MGSFALELNTQVILEGTQLKLRKKVNEKSWQLEDASNGRIFEREASDLFQLYAQGRLKFIGGHSLPKRDKARIALSDSEKQTVGWRFAFVKAVLQLPITKAAFEPVIKEVWEKQKQESADIASGKKRKIKRLPGWISVYRWRLCYERSGHDARSLVVPTRNRLVDLDSDLVEIIDGCLDEVYLTRERNTLQDAIDVVRHQVKNANVRREDLGIPLLDIPNRRIVKNRLAMNSAFDIYAARFGRQAALTKFRSVKGHRTTDAALERAEIDHTPLDLFVIDDYTLLPLGRPYITACIDDYTRCILGLYVGFVPPSYQSVALCLKHAFLPKVSLKEDYPDVQNDWPFFGVMRELVVDQGAEFHSEALEEACRCLGTEIHYAPRKQGWFKAKIERLLGRLNSEVAHGTKGTTFSNIFEKGDYNPEKHAVIRRSTLELGLHMWICDIYHHKKHSSLGMPPAHMWMANVRPEDIRLPGDRAALDFIMGTPYRRTLTHKGIEFDNLYYGSDALHELRIRYGPKLHVEIRVDVSNVGCINVLYDNEIVQAKALKFSYADGLSLWLHRLIQANSPKSDPDAWLAAKERLRQLFRNEFSVMRKLPRRGMGRYIEEQKSLEAPVLSKTNLLPASTYAPTPPETAMVTPISRSVPAPRYKAIINRKG